MEVTQEGDGVLNAIVAQGTGCFYGESGVVFPQGFYLSTHLCGTYSGGGEAASILRKAHACMQAALKRETGPDAPSDAVLNQFAWGQEHLRRLGGSGLICV